MSINHSFWRFFSLAVFIIILGSTVALPVASQPPVQCTLSGFVVDPQGRGVPDATVRLALEGNGLLFFSTSNSLGRYTIQFPLPSATTHGSVYVQRRKLQDSVLLMTGAIDFRSCRQERNVFVNSNDDVTSGPPAPLGPGVPPPYPGPSAPPSDSLAEVVIYLDLRTLPLGGLVPGSKTRLPICVSNIGATGQSIQINGVDWHAAFLPEQIRLSNLSQVTHDFEQLPNQEINNDTGRISYNAASSDLVTLPRWPECSVLATVEVTADWALQPGDVAWLINLSGTTVNITGHQSDSGIVTRTTTYLDVVSTRRVYLPVVPRKVIIAPTLPTASLVR